MKSFGGTARRSAALVVAVVSFAMALGIAAAGLIGDSWQLATIGLSMALLTVFVTVVLIGSVTVRSIASHRTGSVLDGVAQLRRELGTVGRDLDAFRQAWKPGDGGLRTGLRIENQRDIAAMLALQSSLPHGIPRVPLSVYSALPETVERLCALARGLPAGSLVVELGSGWSTIALADVARGTGIRVVSIEHDAEWIEVTREALAVAGLDEVVELRAAPLENGNDGATAWYSHAAVTDLHDVALLFIDGPPGMTGPRARWGALETFADRLTPSAVVVIDDVHRDDEQQLVEAFVQRGGREVVRLERSSVVQVSSR